MTRIGRFCPGVRSGILAFSMLLLAVGCQSNRPSATVEMQSTEDTRRMEQRFGKAIFSRDAGGDYDIVLLEQYEPSQAKSKKGAITNVSSVPLMQVLHIKVLWRPKTMTRADAPTATNCTLRYTVLAGDDSGVVSYEGVGFANVYGGTDQVRVILSNARISPTSKRGSLEDPLGKATLEADFKAKLDSASVKSILTMVRDAMNYNPNNPPARPPTP